MTRFKPLTYGLMHLVVAIAVAYALTRDLTLALGIGLIEPFVQTLAYTVHERVWARAVTSSTHEEEVISHACLHGSVLS